MAKYKVLSTKKLEPSLVEKAEQSGIEIIEQEFISIKPVYNLNLPEDLPEFGEGTANHVVFTSQNAVFAIENVIKNLFQTELNVYNADWRVFCLSGKTKETLLQTICSAEQIVGAAENSTSLAQIIIEKGTKEVIFFCGKQRRDELPSQLKQAGIKVHEIVVYETVETPTINSEDVGAILFFSPSAVQSFFSVNSLRKETVCFAIGKTTADSIADFTDNKIIVSESPSQEMMLAAVNFYFQNINCYE